jgi:hypothetical protein
MLEELEIFQGVDFPLDCCLVDVILLQLSKYDLCRLAISISLTEKGPGKKKPKQNLHRYAKNTLVSTSPPHLLFSRLLKKKLSSKKTSEKLQCTAIVMLRQRLSTTAL